MEMSAWETRTAGFGVYATKTGVFQGLCIATAFAVGLSGLVARL